MLYLIDLDETVVNFLDPLIEKHNLQTNSNLTRKDIKTWDLETYGISKTLYQQPGFFYALKPFEGAIETLYRMHQYGNKLWVVTNSMNVECVEHDKHKWVREHIPFVRGIIFTDRKYELPGDVMVDDCPEYLSKFKNTTVKFNKPYNKTVRADYEVNSWKDLHKLLF